MIRFLVILIGTSVYFEVGGLITYHLLKVSEHRSPLTLFTIKIIELILISSFLNSITDWGQIINIIVSTIHIVVYSWGFYNGYEGRGSRESRVALLLDYIAVLYFLFHSFL